MELIDNLFDQRHQTLSDKLSCSPSLLTQLTHVACLSDYFFETCQKPWINVSAFEGPLDTQFAEQALSTALNAAEDEVAAKRVLRYFRHQCMSHIIFKRLTSGDQAWSLNQVLAQELKWLSWLADTCVNQALTWQSQQLASMLGTPLDQGQPQQLLVLAMGKHGAQELNLSSDIDLIFCFPSSGDTQGGRRSISNQEYFTRLGQKLIALLDERTVDGQVFRVDMRLRPYGQSGPLAVNFSSMNEYYSTQGRDWERFAMIKCRPTVTNAVSQLLMDQLKPFIYRQYVDYSAIDSLRSMKGLIEQEVRRKRLDNNIKLGSGGIREIEFIVQAFQLIRGGQDTELQVRHCMSVLERLSDLGYLPQAATQELLAAYQFLRNLEHCIQLIKDEQTQELPVDELDKQRVASMMQFNDWAALETELNQQREKVSYHFSQIVADRVQTEEAKSDQFKTAWMSDDESLQIESLSEDFADDAEEIAKKLTQFRQSKSVSMMQAIARERLDQVMPKILSGLVETLEDASPLKVLDRLLPLLDAVTRRSVYLSLINENPVVIKQWILLSKASSWIADQLAKHPVLLDELLTPSALYSPPNKEELNSDLTTKLLRIDEFDTEQQMFAVRQFIQSHKLQTAASEITTARHLMKASDYLTYIAEVVLSHSLAIIWRQLTDRYGFPKRADGSSSTEPEMVIIGYGKLGGIELNYESDLDLVFIHGADPKGHTDGEKSIENGVFYTRLGQRLIQFLTAMTPLGQAYEVDMRLRPDGNSGVIVTSMEAFKHYQQNEAWTWEHQALVRARPVAGSHGLAEQFEDIRASILSTSREVKKLAVDVKEMREKMRVHLGSGKDGNGTFHLKQDSGGIVDIEFLVQFAVLCWSKTHPSVMEFTDNIRILESLEKESLLSAEQVTALNDAYLYYRGVLHSKALQQQKLIINIESKLGRTLDQHRQRVVKVWDEVLESKI